MRVSMLLGLLVTIVSVVVAEASINVECDERGPAYWCQSIKTAVHCSAVHHCLTTVWSRPLPQTAACRQCMGAVRDGVVYAKKVCGGQGGMQQEECTHLIDSFNVHLVGMGVQFGAGPAAICAALNMCREESKAELSNSLSDLVAPNPAPQAVHDVGNAKCEDCRQKGRDAKFWLASADNQQKVVGKLVAFYCAHLHGDNKKACVELIHYHIPQIFSLLSQAVRPKFFCALLSECPFANNTRQAERDVQAFAVDLSKSILSGILQFLGNPGGSNRCETCRQVGRDVKKWLSSDKNQAKVTQGMTVLYCDKQHSENEKQACKELMSYHLPQILTLLSEAVRPKFFCALLYLCPFANSTATTAPAMREVATDDSSCETCKKFVKQIDEMIKQNQTQTDIEDYLIFWCQILYFYDADMEQECEDSVRTNVPIVLKIIENNDDPTQVCTILGFCSFSGADLCENCEAQYRGYQMLLKSESAHTTAVTYMIEVACRRLSDSNEIKICESLVSFHMPSMLQFLAQSINPRFLCEYREDCQYSNQENAQQASNSPEMPETRKLCFLCKTWVDNIKEKLKENETKENIEKYLFSRCDQWFLHNPKLINECKAAVRKDVPKLIDLIEKGYDPGNVCFWLGYCATETTMVSNQPLVQMNEAGQFCNICKSIVQQVANMVANNATDQEIEQFLLNYCSIIFHFDPNLEAQCKDGVKKDLPKIIQMIENNDDPTTVCTELGLCSDKSKSIPLVEEIIEVATERRPNAGGIYCNSCKGVVKDVEKMIKKNSTEEEIRKYLLRKCKTLLALFPDLQKQCVDTVNNNLTEIIDYIEKSESPEKVCKDLGLCTTTVAAGQFCSVCKAVIQEVDTMVTNNATDAEIEQYLLNYCSIVFSFDPNLQGQCQKGVRRDLPKIIKMINNHDDPSTICASLGLCLDVIKNDKSLNNAGGGQFCSICKSIVQQVANMVANNATDQEIEQFLLNYCTTVFSFDPTLETQCKEWVKANLPKIIQMIENNDDPTTVCTSLGLCLSLVSNHKKQAGQFCDICKSIVQQVANMVANNATDQEIEQFLLNYCTIVFSFDPSLEAQCKDAVKKDLPKIIQMIENNDDPTTVCTELGFCTAAARCESCCDVYRQMKVQLMNSHDNLGSILSESMSESICDIQPNSAPTKCRDYVRKSVFDMLVSLSRVIRPKFFCAINKECSFVSAIPTAHLPVPSVSNIPARSNCTLCKLMVIEVKRQLKNNATQQQIEQELNNTCKALFNASRVLLKECQALVKKDVPIIIKMIENNSNATVICEELGLCPKAFAVTTNLPVERAEKLHVQERCDLCKGIVDEVRQMLMVKKSQKEIMGYMLLSCNLLFYNDVDKINRCNQVITTQLPDIINLVKNKTDSRIICQKFGACITTQGTQMWENKCHLCKLMIVEGKWLIENGSPQQDMKGYLRAMCQVLYFSRQREQARCNSNVQKYLTKILYYIESDSHGTLPCEIIGVQCNHAQPGITTFVDHLAPTGAICDLCKLTVNQVKKQLQQNQTQAQIEQYLLNTCVLLFPEKTLQKVCNDTVKTDLPKVIQMIENDLNATQICEELGLCKNATVIHAPMDPDNCTTCQLLVLQVRVMLQNNATQDQILAALINHCKQLYPTDPTKEKACEDKARKDLPIVIQMIKNGYSTHEICVKLGECPSQQKHRNRTRRSLPSPLEMQASAKPSGAICDFCKLMVEQVKKQLKENQTQAQIEQYLLNTCVLLFPEKTLQKVCNDTVKADLPKVIQMIENDLNATQVCEELGMCKNATLVHPPMDPDDCALCKVLVQQVRMMLQMNATQDQILAALINHCKQLYPSDPTKEKACENEVKKDLPLVIYLIKYGYSTQATCDYMGACPNVSGKSDAQTTSNNVADPDGCTVCQYMVFHVRVMMQMNFTQNEILSILLLDCLQVYPTHPVSCQVLITLDLPVIIQMIDNGTATHAICVNLGSCTKVSLKADARTTSPPNNVAGPDNCTVCQYMVFHVRVLMQMGLNQNEMLPLLVLDCLQIYSDPSNCEEAIGKDLPQVIKDINNGISTFSICKTLHFCTSGQIDYVKTQRAMTSKSVPMTSIISVALPRPQMPLGMGGVEKINVKCLACLAVFDDVERKIKQNDSTADIVKSMEKICQVMPNSENVCCKKTVSVIGPIIVYMMKHGTTPRQMCVYLSLCTPKAKDMSRGLLQLPATPAKPSPGPCLFCRIIIGQIEKQLNWNATEQEIINAVTNACKLLPADLKKQCEDFMNTYGKEIIKLLMDGTKPGVICKLLGLCKLGKGVVSTLPQRPEQKYVCPMCVVLMDEVKLQLERNASQEEILVVVNDTCNLLPSASDRDCCHKYVKVFGALVVRMLVDGVSPNKICQELNICNHTAKMSRMSVSNSSVECWLCEFIMREVEQEIKKNSSEQEILTAVETACLVLPSTLKTDCRKVVHEFGPLVIKLILAGYNPAKVCRMINMCNETTSALEKFPQKAQQQQHKGVSNSSTDCNTCKFIVKAIEVQIETNATESEILAEMDKLCKAMPSILAIECDAMVKLYGKAIIELLIQKYTPDDVCKIIGACKSEQKNTQIQRVPSGSMCVLCRIIMTYTDAQITDPLAEQSISKELENTCVVFPPKYDLRKICRDFIAQFGPQAISILIRHHVTPDGVCHELGICPAGEQHNTAAAQVDFSWRKLSP